MIRGRTNMNVRCIGFHDREKDKQECVRCIGFHDRGKDKHEC